MIYVAAALTGLGGLLVQLVLVRRHGLLLGNTAEAASLVLGVFLLGLGVGGLLVARLVPRVRDPLRASALLYALVGLSAALLDLFVERLGPMSLGTGLLVVLLHPGLPTVLMGLAFPLLFGALGSESLRWRVGALVGANLGGSLIGTALGGNLWIPELGFRTTLWIGVGAYALAACTLLAESRRRKGQAGPTWVALPPGPHPALGRLAVAAALAGGGVIGFEVFLLRRLPFFLEGFQPTLSGVIGCCLLALTAGSAFGTGLLARGFGERAAGVALLLGALTMNLGLQEHFVLPLSQFQVASELGLHLRTWLGALVVAGPPCFFLGAVVPLCVARFEDPGLRAVLGGRLYFWEGFGSFLGALFVGQLLPRVWPEGFFVLTPLALGGVMLVLLAGWLRPPVLLGAAAALLAASLLGWSGAGSLLAPAPPLVGFRFDRPYTFRHLDHATDSVVTASVAYDRSRHSMVLYTDEFRATETGPQAGYMRVLGHLPFLLRDDIERAAVIGLGTGTTARSLAAWERPRELHVVEISRAVFSMLPQFSGGAGPLSEPVPPAFLSDPRTRVHITDGRRFLALREPDSLELVTMEPLLPYAPGTVPLYTSNFYALARRALTPDGLLLQWIPTFAVPPEQYDTLLATFARSFPYTSIWLVDQATLLVGSEQPHLPSPEVLEARLARMPAEAALSLHEARLAGADDLLAAYVGDAVLDVVGDAPELHDDRPFLERVGTWKHDRRRLLSFYPNNLERLRQLAKASEGGPFGAADWVRIREARLWGLQYLAASIPIGPKALENNREGLVWLGRARKLLPGSVLLHGEETLALRRFTEREIARRRGRGVTRLVERLLQRDERSALVQAVLGLDGTTSGEALPAREAAANATAIDPLFFLEAPDFLRELAPAEPRQSPLESVEYLPQGPALAHAAAAGDAAALALRAFYPVRCAEALLDALAERPLTPAEQRALAPILDPKLLAVAVARVEARGGSPGEELRPIWHDDLPAPTDLVFAGAPLGAGEAAR